MFHVSVLSAEGLTDRVPVCGNPINGRTRIETVYFEVYTVYTCVVVLIAFAFTVYDKKQEEVNNTPVECVDEQTALSVYTCSWRHSVSVYQLFRPTPSNFLARELIHELLCSPSPSASSTVGYDGRGSKSHKRWLLR